MKVKGAIAATTFAVGAALPGVALAQATMPVSDEWRFHAIVYGWLPDIGGKTDFPIPGGGPSINVDVSQILRNLNFTFMGTLEAQKGPWGVITDLIYLDVSGSKSKTRNVSLGNYELPAGATLDAHLKVTGTIWTLSGEYTTYKDPNAEIDVMVGTRLLDMKETLDYNFSADLGPFVGPGRSGGTSVNLSYWDAIVAARGRFLFGADKEWIVPVYADAGTGQSRVTWQLVGGVAYQFKWGQVLAVWRYLEYDFKSSSKVENVNFNGPMIGVGFNW